ncbi:MAG: hypothetical protein CBC13_06495 [Planctomycetia bacterium TMED53]|nr:MAG: hypothetical protein CBC13_06495 [Planctomycetia bacterium TMED53]
MPHAILGGKLDLEEVWTEFSPHKEVHGAKIQNYCACFLRNDRQQLLFRCIAIDLGVTQSFYIVVEDKGSSTTVKCVDDPHLEKGPVVQEMIVKISETLITKGMTLEKTNLAALQKSPSEEESC